MASAEKLPSGRWRGLYRDASGGKQRVPGTFPRKSDARDAAIEAEAKAKRQAAAKTGELSAKTPWSEWWSVFGENRSTPADTDIVAAQLAGRFILPRWGDLPLNAITRRDVQAWVDGLGRDYSANYVRNIYAVFAVSINAALDREILTASPCASVKLPRRPKGVKPHVTVDEAPTLRKHINPRFADAIDFMLETGLRPGELAGLHVHRLDLEHGWMTVAETYVRRKKVIRPLPKDGDTRQVVLSTKAMEIVRRLLTGRDLTKGCGVEHTNGAKCSSELVFRNVRGGVLNSDLLTRRMREAAAAAKIPPKNGYSLRRGFATRAIAGGADVFAVQRTMGHADLEELAGYVQETPAARAQMLAALGEVQPLAAVKAVGRRGTSRGTDLDNQPLPTTTREEETNTG